MILCLGSGYYTNIGYSLLGIVSTYIFFLHHFFVLFDSRYLPDVEVLDDYDQYHLLPSVNCLNFAFFSSNKREVHNASVTQPGKQ